jgi:hypothetical protein
VLRCRNGCAFQRIPSAAVIALATAAISRLPLLPGAIVWERRSVSGLARILHQLDFQWFFPGGAICGRAGRGKTRVILWFFIDVYLVLWLNRSIAI